MRLVVDTHVCVSELLRVRGQRLFEEPSLEFFMAEHIWHEATYELGKRVAALVRHRRVSDDAAGLLLNTAPDVRASYVTMISSMRYGKYEERAKSRIPRDAADWPTVAVAVLLDAAIWTRDNDLLGCGCPTWSTETLLAEMTQRS